MVLSTDQMSDQKQLNCSVLDRDTSSMSGFHGYESPSRLTLVEHPSTWSTSHLPAWVYLLLSPSALDLRTLEDVHWVSGTRLLA